MFPDCGGPIPFRFRSLTYFFHQFVDVFLCRLVIDHDSGMKAANTNACLPFPECVQHLLLNVVSFKLLQHHVINRLRFR